MTPPSLKCARCQQPMRLADATEVPADQGTSASLAYIHRAACRTPRAQQHR